MCFGDLCLKPKTWGGFQKPWRKAMMFQKNWCLKTTRHSRAIYSNTINLETPLWTKSSALPRSSRPSKLESWFLMISPPQKTTKNTASLCHPGTRWFKASSKVKPKCKRYHRLSFLAIPQKGGSWGPKKQGSDKSPGDSDAVAVTYPRSLEVTYIAPSKVTDLAIPKRSRLQNHQASGSLHCLFWGWFKTPKTVTVGMGNIKGRSLIQVSNEYLDDFLILDLFVWWLFLQGKSPCKNHPCIGKKQIQD